jgi:hypothetical protein
MIDPTTNASSKNPDVGMRMTEMRTIRNSLPTPGLIPIFAVDIFEALLTIST